MHKIPHGPRFYCAESAILIKLQIQGTMVDSSDMAIPSMTGNLLYIIDLVKVH